MSNIHPPARATSSRADMRAVGMSLGEMNQRNLAERRHKKGECPTCGNKTHKIGLFGKRTALTIDGSCLYGRCLLCYPVEGYTRRPAEAVAQPHTQAHAQGHNTHIPHAHAQVVTQAQAHAQQTHAHAHTQLPPQGMDNIPHTQVQGQGQLQGQVAPLAPAVSAVGLLPNLVTSNFVIETEDRGDIPDDNTMVSGITMDHRLIVGARNWNGEVVGDELYEEDDDSLTGGAWGAGGQGRPEPSVGGMDDMKPPERRRGSRGDDNSMISANGGPQNSGRPSGPPRRYSNNHDLMMDQVGQNIAATEIRPRKNSRQPSAGAMRPLDENESFSAGGILGKPRTVSPSSISRGGSNHDRRFSGKSSDHYAAPLDYRGEEKLEIDSASRHWDPNPQEYAINENNRLSPSSRGRPRVDASDPIQAEAYGDPAFERDLRAMDRNQQFRRTQAQSEEVPPPSAEPERARSGGGVARYGGSVWSSNNGPPPLVDRSRRGLPDDGDFAEGLGRGGGRPQANVRPPREPSDSNMHQSSVSVDDIADIIDTLDHTNRVRGFQALAELIMANGQMAKERIRESDGIQILVECMWTDMTDPAVMEAACELLFALTASSDGNPDSDVLVGDSAEGAVDALLITMQTHIGAESIQSSGCGTLHCLASASSTNKDVPDGTLSGAVFTVVNAMDMHRQSQEVQEWGIRALYSQCMLSRHAESNKKNLAQSGHDGGGGMGVIRNAMETAKSDLVTVELACRLYWSLAANEDVARELMDTPGAFNAIVDALNRYIKKPEAAPMMEAVFGALANLARVCENQLLFRDSDVVRRATQSIKAFHYGEVLYIEACALLGVLATDRRNCELLISFDVVNVISKLMQRYEHNQMLQEEALWALVCLTHGSNLGKLALSNEIIVGAIIRLMRDKKSCPVIREMACTLIGSLCVLKESAQVAVTLGAIDNVLALLKDHPNERRIHEAAFVTLRNITSQGTGVDLFLKFETAKTILDAMTASTNSVAAQLNACCLLWNICAKAKKDPSALVDAGAIMQVVKAMQIHMESGEVLEMACGTLWCLIDQSDTRKKELLGCGAIDAVTCTLVMHPKEPPTLEKACGLLANVCTSTHMAEAIADSQGISMVVEAMTNNSSSMKLLELGTLVLRNMVLTNHEFATEASNGISAVINCMKDNPDAVGFQREACNTLWALAAQSEECKNKILALDGVTVLMGALEHNSCVGDVQDAARGAINQLALSGPM